MPVHQFRNYAIMQRLNTEMKPNNIDCTYEGPIPIF